MGICTGRSTEPGLGEHEFCSINFYNNLELSLNTLTFSFCSIKLFYVMLYHGSNNFSIFGDFESHYYELSLNVVST